MAPVRSSTNTAIYRFALPTVKNKLIRQIVAPEGASDERAETQAVRDITIDQPN